MLQLTACIVREPLTSGEIFVISLDRCVIVESEVRGTLLRVQDLVRSPHFAQRNFFSDSRIAMLTQSATICDSIPSSAVFELWSQVEFASRSQMVADVCASVNRAVNRRRASRIQKNNGMRWAVSDHPLKTQHHLLG